MLINMNLPPNERVKLENILLCSFTPGPQELKILDSFLYPLLQEFLLLEKGVKIWDGFRGMRFQLYAHICVIGADPQGREKFMHVSSTRAYRYCADCMA